MICFQHNSHESLLFNISKTVLLFCLLMPLDPSRQICRADNDNVCMPSVAKRPDYFNMPLIREFQRGNNPLNQKTTCNRPMRGFFITAPMISKYIILFPVTVLFASCARDAVKS